MKRKASRLALFLSLAVAGLFALVGCADPNIIPAGKIAKGRVTLAWSDFPGAVSYNIYFDSKAGLTKWTSHKIPNASNPITITDLLLGSTYYFGIAVVRESGESSILSEKSYVASNEAGSIHFGDPAPESLKAKGQVEKREPPEAQPTVASDNVPKSKEAKAQEVGGKPTKEQKPGGQATLAWDHVPHAASYNIYWSESPGVSKRNGKKITNATNPYTLKGLTRGKTYYFVVTAVNNSGESKESEELSFSVKE